jgi:hypothetical protein
VDNGWIQEVGKRFEDIYELTSSTLLPKNLPTDKLHEDVATPLATSHIIPLTIKITKSNKEERVSSQPRVLIAVLQAMQNVFPETYIVRNVVGDENKGFFNINMVTTSADVLSHYFEDAEEVNSGSLLARVYINSNHPLLEYKKNPKFNKYMSQEHIILEEIRLTSVNPSTLGYLEQVVPEPDNLRMHTIRIRKYLPEKHPKLQLFSKTLYDSRRRGTRVVMIKCDKEDYDELQDQFLTLNTQQVLNFFPWKEFTSLNDPLRDMAFQKAFDFNKNYRSVTLEGFRDNEDNIPMRYKVRQTGQVENAVTDPMGTMLVSDYLGTLTAANGTQLFSHVYEPIAGVRDTLVHVDNYTEAKVFAKVALIKLGREMNSASRLMVFRDYQEVKEAMNNKPKWKPFT